MNKDKHHSIIYGIVTYQNANRDLTKQK